MDLPDLLTHNDSNQRVPFGSWRSDPHQQIVHGRVQGSCCHWGGELALHQQLLGSDRATVESQVNMVLSGHHRPLDGDACESKSYIL